MAKKQKQPCNLTEDQKAVVLKGLFAEVADLLEKNQSNNELVNQALTDASDRLDVKKPLLRRAARVYWKRNAVVVQTETDEVLDIYALGTK